MVPESVCSSPLVLSNDAQGNSTRVSGGTLTTGSNGTIDLHGTASIVISGTIGQPKTVGSSVTTDLSTVSATSTGHIFVGADVNFLSQATFTGANISVLPGGRIKSRGSNATVTLTAPAGNILVAAAQNGLNAGSVEASALLHLFGNLVRIDGIVTTPRRIGLSLMPWSKLLSPVSLPRSVRSSFTLVSGAHGPRLNCWMQP